MFRSLLSSRLIQVGLIFFVVVVGGSLLYSWQTHRATVAEFSQRDMAPHETRSEQDTVDTSTVDFEQSETPFEVDDLQIVDDTDVSPIDETSEMLDMADAFLPDDFVSEEAPTEDVPVSPFGFGPYPEVPPAYIESRGYPIWYEPNYDNLPASSTHERNIELIDRVMIKMWTEGQIVLNAFYQNGKVYPLYPKSAYVLYIDEADDESHFTRLRVIHSPDFDLELTIEDVHTGNIPAGYQILDLESSGVNPYTFLDL